MKQIKRSGLTRPWVQSRAARQNSEFFFLPSLLFGIFSVLTSEFSLFFEKQGIVGQRTVFTSKRKAMYLKNLLNRSSIAKIPCKFPVSREFQAETGWLGTACTARSTFL